MAEKDKDQSPKTGSKSGSKSKAEQAEEASGSPVPAGTQVSESAGRPRRTQDVEGNPVDEPLD
jgi:hypothetical protein